MTAQIIDGKAIADTHLSHLHNEIIDFTQQYNRQPKLAVLLVGNDHASHLYVQKKQAACERVGILYSTNILPEETIEQELFKHIEAFNHDPSTDGILIQLPLPKHINTQTIIEAVDPTKDVDGFHPYNLGRLTQKKPTIKPCTPQGVMELLRHIDFDITKKNAVIVGTSMIVGRPMGLELLMKNATVTFCHRHTKNLEQHVNNAELLITAAGHRHLIPGNWIRPGAVVIDVGINRLDNGMLCGDVDFNEAKKYAAWITPVPGGVGPMTIAMLIKNTLSIAQKRQTAL